MRYIMLSAVATAALALSSACATAGFGSFGRGVMTGRIFGDGDTGGVPGARIAIPGTGVSATTGHDGSFTIRRLPLGQRQIVISVSGYATVQTPALNLTTRDTIVLRATLQGLVIPAESGSHHRIRMLCKVV